MIIECTADTPWSGQKMPIERVRHHDTEEIGEQEDGYPGGDIVRIRCKNCGCSWKEELPQ